jgi:hypothetical protein
MLNTRVVLFALLALFIVAPVSAQVDLGVMGGLNASNLSGENVAGEKIDFSGRAGFGIGGVLDVRLSEKVALRLEPMYLQKGAEYYETDQQFGALKVAVKAANLEMPVLLKIDLGAGATRPYLIAGPTIGFALSSKFEFSALGNTIDIDIDHASTELGLAFGGGVSFPVGSGSFFVEGRYGLGLTDIVKDDVIEFMGEQSPVEVDVKTRGVQLMAGMTFPLGGN